MSSKNDDQSGYNLDLELLNHLVLINLVVHILGELIIPNSVSLLNHLVLSNLVVHIFGELIIPNSVSLWY
jgi:hypothetical protein